MIALLLKQADPMLAITTMPDNKAMSGVGHKRP
jgi:hypothetical protein